ncbi:venom allergen 5-like [Amblyomma americanum]
MESRVKSAAARSLLVVALAAVAADPRGTAFAKCRPEYRNLPGGLVHTACKPPNPRCTFVVTGLNDSERAVVLKAHNDYRSQVAQGRLSGFQPATNMYRLKWDEELAEVAQAFTNLCDDSKHDDKRQRITSKFKEVGQNLAWNYESVDRRNVDGVGRVKDWFDEYKDFSPNNVHPFKVSRGPAVLHFTQVAWAETRYVGCGYTHYKENDPKYAFKKLFACNYAPGGNIIGRSMYNTGRTCSDCPSDTTCNVATGLCRVPGESDDFGSPGDGGGDVWPWLVLAFILLGVPAAAGVGAMIYKRTARSASASRAVVVTAPRKGANARNEPETQRPLAPNCT